MTTIRQEEISQPSAEASTEVELLIPLPEAAELVQLHRATLNEMIHQGRLTAVRRGARWFVDPLVLAKFAATYRRPPNVPYRQRRDAPIEEQLRQVVALLEDWGEGSVPELAEVMGRHEGNIRKYLSLLRSRGIATRDTEGLWRLAS